MYLEGNYEETLQSAFLVVQRAPRYAPALDLISLIREAIGEYRKALGASIARPLLLGTREKWIRLTEMAHSLGDAKNAVFCAGKVPDFPSDDSGIDIAVRRIEAEAHRVLGDFTRACWSFAECAVSASAAANETEIPPPPPPPPSSSPSPLAPASTAASSSSSMMKPWEESSALGPLPAHFRISHLPHGERAEVLSSGCARVETRLTRNLDMAFALNTHYLTSTYRQRLLVMMEKMILTWSEPPLISQEELLSLIEKHGADIQGLSSEETHLQGTFSISPEVAVKVCHHPEPVDNPYSLFSVLDAAQRRPYSERYTYARPSYHQPKTAAATSTSSSSSSSSFSEDCAASSEEPSTAASTEPSLHTSLYARALDELVERGLMNPNVAYGEFSLAAAMKAAGGVGRFPCPAGVDEPLPDLHDDAAEGDEFDFNALSAMAAKRSAEAAATTLAQPEGGAGKGSGASEAMAEPIFQREVTVVHRLLRLTRDGGVDVDLLAMWLAGMIEEGYPHDALSLLCRLLLRWNTRHPLPESASLVNASTSSGETAALLSHDDPQVLMLANHVLWITSRICNLVAIARNRIRIAKRIRIATSSTTAKREGKILYALSIEASNCLGVRIGRSTAGSARSGGDRFAGEALIPPEVLAVMKTADSEVFFWPLIAKALHLIRIRREGAQHCSETTSGSSSGSKDQHAQQERITRSHPYRFTGTPQ